MPILKLLGTLYSQVGCHLNQVEHPGALHRHKESHLVLAADRKLCAFGSETSLHILGLAHNPSSVMVRSERQLLNTSLAARSPTFIMSNQAGQLLPD